MSRNQGQIQQMRSLIPTLTFATKVNNSYSLLKPTV